MARYSFDVRTSLGEITANHQFQEACFDSVRSGNTLMVPIHELQTEITCLEYILDAVRSIDNEYVDQDFFENLSHPGIDLNTGCHAIDNDSSPTSCIPKVIDAYVAVSNNDFRMVRDLGGDRDHATLTMQQSMPKAQKPMKTIVTKYIGEMSQNSCRPHNDRRRYGDSRDYLTCFEKLINEGNNVDFIDVNAIDPSFFDIPLCHGSSGSTNVRRCFSNIIEYATSAPSYPKDYPRRDNCKVLLRDMIRSKRFEDRFYIDNDVCGEGRTCFDVILYSHQSLDGAAPIRDVIQTYTDKGIIDMESEGSPFHGEKCKYLGTAGNIESCMDTAVRSVSRLFDGYDPVVQEAGKDIGLILLTQPRYLSECGLMKFLNVMATTENLRHHVTDKAGQFLDIVVNPFFGNWVGDSINFDHLKTFNCVSELGRTSRTTISGLDYAMELGSPIDYAIYNRGMPTENLLRDINSAECTSIVTGDPMPCLQKLTKELMIDYSHKDPTLRQSTKAIIERILLSGGTEIDPILFPKDKPFFTDYVVDSINHAIIVNTGVAVESMDILAMVMKKMGQHAEDYGEKFQDMEDNKRVWKIYDTIEEAHRRYPSNEHALRFRSPSPLRYAMMNACYHTPEDIEKAIGCGLFSYGKSKSSIEVLSSWYGEYKDNPDVISMISRQFNQNKKILSGFFKSYIHVQQGIVKSDNDAIFTPDMYKLFEIAYGSPMSEYFKPSLKTRILYDEMCFHQSGTSDHDFLVDIFDDVEGNSKLHRDPKNIVGVYDVSVGKSGEWSNEHVIRYASAISRILYGSEYPIGEPYIIREEKMRAVPVGLLEAINTLSDYEFIGKKTDNVRGKIKLDVYPLVRPTDVTGNPDYVVNSFRSEGNDFMIDMYYQDITGNTLPQLRTQFPMKEALQKLPKKLKGKLQEKYPYLFGQLDAVLAMEIDAKNKPDEPDLSTYKLVISNKPTDIIRASGCQQWDSVSCMSIFGGSHNDSLESYLNAGSYIAYLTKKSEYEPQWLARLYMHQCDNCKCVSIQDRLRYYEVDRGESRKYPNWHLLYDAVKVVLADKGVNSVGHNRRCEFKWGTNVREDIEENGDPRCDDEMNERTDECVGECQDDCETDSKIESFLDDISGDVQDEVDRRFAAAVKEHTIENEDGEEELDTDEDTLREEIEEEVRDSYEGDLLDEKISDCKDGCDEECSYINDDFDCVHYLDEIGALDDDDSDVWTDNDDVKALAKDSSSYKGIVKERTGQDEDAAKFVRQVKTEF
jgi:hypothetical protein